MIKVAIANQKGGVGKTTSTVNLAFALARMGKQVLLVDLDAQGSLTEYLVKNYLSLPESDTVYSMLVYGDEIEPIQVAENIELLPATTELAYAEQLLLPKPNSGKVLDRMLRAYEADYCLIDCSPSLGILTLNALGAADLVLIPVATELMAERTIKLIMKTIDEVIKNELNTGLKPWLILPTMYDGRLLHHREILQALKDKYGRLVHFEPVRATTRYKDAVSARMDISGIDRDLGGYWERLADLLIVKDVVHA